MRKDLLVHRALIGASVRAHGLSQVHLFVAGEATDVLNFVNGSQFLLLKFSRQHKHYLLNFILNKGKSGYDFFLFGKTQDSCIDGT